MRVQQSSKLKTQQDLTAIIFSGRREVSPSANTMTNPVLPEVLTVCMEVPSDISAGNCEKEWNTIAVTGQRCFASIPALFLLLL